MGAEAQPAAVCGRRLRPGAPHLALLDEQNAQDPEADGAVLLHLRLLLFFLRLHPAGARQVLQLSLAAPHPAQDSQLLPSSRLRVALALMRRVASAFASVFPPRRQQGPANYESPEVQQGACGSAIQPGGILLEVLAGQ